MDELKIKWCTDFRLLGIYFDVTLSKMQINYEKAIETVKKELHSWKHRFLTVFGKITVIKTMCLPKLNHIVTVVPNPYLTYLKQLDFEFKKIINEKKPLL